MSQTKDLETVIPEGELWAFPSELTSLERALDIGEQYQAYKWWEVLQQEDQGPIANFLSLMKSFMDEQTEEFIIYGIEDPLYAALLAIGSTARHEESYNDVDFLFITNMIYRDMDRFDPHGELVWDFDYSIDPTIPEAYEGRMPKHKPRSLITLIPRETDGKKIHLTLQPEVRSVEDWLEVDDKANILLYRTDHERGLVRR
jgi:hypothetical protein